MSRMRFLGIMENVALRLKKTSSKHCMSGKEIWFMLIPYF